MYQRLDTLTSYHTVLNRLDAQHDLGEDRQPAFFQLRLDSLLAQGLSKRAFNILENMKVKTLGDMRFLSTYTLQSTRNMGEGSLQSIVETCAKTGVPLYDDMADVENPSRLQDAIRHGVGYWEDKTGPESIYYPSDKEKLEQFTHNMARDLKENNADALFIQNKTLTLQQIEALEKAGMSVEVAYFITPHNKK